MTAGELRGLTAKVFPVSPVDLYLLAPDGTTTPLAIHQGYGHCGCEEHGGGPCRPTEVPRLVLVLKPAGPSMPAEGA